MRRKLRVRFIGGVWDGLHDIWEPLPPEIAVAAETYANMRIGSDEIPAYALFPKDVYRLEVFRDETGIPEKRYRLREMTR